jgi:hypothetical protein
MTPEELISNIHRMGKQDLCVVLQYLADRVYDARFPTIDGERKLCDLIDFKLWLEELAKAANAKMMGRLPVRGEQPRWGSWPR